MKHLIKKRLNEELTKRNIKGEYFYKILNILFKDKLNNDFINQHRKDIESTLINRAKENLDNKPTPDKINNWKSQINQVLDFYLSGKFDIEDSDDIKKYNMDLFNKSLNNPTIKDYIFGSNGLVNDIYYELGYKNVKKYIEKESNSSIMNRDFVDNGIYKLLKYQPNDDEEDKILKKQILHFFLRRVVANIPSDKKLSMSEDDILNWLKTYTYKFIYGYADKYKDI